MTETKHPGDRPIANRRWLGLRAALASALGPLLLQADPPRLQDALQQVSTQAPIKAFGFDLKDVRLLEGPFKRALELDHQYLLSLDVDQLLHTFRLNAGLPSSAKPLGGWEEPKCELRGHFAGHYLSACALMYASTGDAWLRDKGDALVAGLAECQRALGTGYLSAYPETFLDRVERLERVWAPYYTLHKIYAGLLDTYVHCGNAQALEVCRKFADWVIARNERLTDEQMEKMLGNEHGGMNETLANLYALTGEPKYLSIARRFNHQAVLEPLARQEDRLSGLHANTQFPKVIGLARQYELTGNPTCRAAAEFFWKVVTQERSYVIGGNSDNEAFSPKEQLSQHLGPASTETCNTYNMLKLTRHLFAWEPKAGYADYYERALYNHILASQNPEDGMMDYYVPLKTGCGKAVHTPLGFSTPLDSFWCCVGTGVENHAKYGDSIYFTDGDQTLYVNLFIASELNWRAKGLSVRQETRYPEAGATRLVFTSAKPVALELKLRHPYWAVSGFEVKVNGRVHRTASTPGGWASVRRPWRSGDTVDVAMPMSLRTEGFRDNPGRIALLYGPLVLCAWTTPGNNLAAIRATSDQVLNQVRPAPHRALRFQAPASIFRTSFERDDGKVVLVPFYQEYQKAYAVYWDVLDDAQWQALEQDYRAERARQKELETRTVDYVTPGQEQNERDHKLASERSAAGDFGDRKWRHATEGGWFSYELKVLADQPQELWVTYWGSDGGNRVFEVLVDGAKIATQRLQNNRPNKFYDEVYPLSEALLKGKQKVTVKFQAQPDATAGGVFGVRTMKR